MNSNGHSQKLSSTKPKKLQCINKVKLNDLSKFIFDKIRQNSPLEDSRLMQLLFKEFGQQKIESLKRRKYDVINILEKAEIVLIDRSIQSNVQYSPRTSVLNAVKDVQKIREEVLLKTELIRKKRQEMKMLMHTRKNLEKLIQINKNREIEQKNKIQLPILMITKQFTRYSREDDLKHKQQLLLEFPPKTQYINNFMGVQNMIRTSY